MDHSLNSLNNFDFLTRSFARAHAEDRPIDILAVTGNIGEEHRTWFYVRYAWYYQQMVQARELELEHRYYGPSDPFLWCFILLYQLTG